MPLRLYFVPDLMVLSTLQTLEIELSEALLQLVVLLALVLMVAFFVAAELSLVAASDEQLNQLTQQASTPGKAKAFQLVQHAQNNLPHYLSVTQTGTTAGSLLLGWLGEGVTVRWIEPGIRYLPIGKLPVTVTAHSIAVVVAFLLVIYVEILLGELIPKVLAANAPEHTALILIRPLQLCSYIFWPLLVFLNGNVQLLTAWVRHSTPSPEQSVPLTPIIRTDLHSVLVPGVLDLTMVNQELGLTLPTSSAYQSLAGFMIHRLGRLPTQGERLLWGELELEAASIVNDQLATVRLRHVTHPLLIPQAKSVMPVTSK